MLKSLLKVGSGAVAAVAILAGIAAFGPTSAGVFGSQKAEAAGCTTNYYRITAQSVSVHASASWGSPTITTLYKGKVIGGTHGWLSNGWTSVGPFYVGNGSYQSGWIPDQYRTYLYCN